MTMQHPPVVEARSRNSPRNPWTTASEALTLVGMQEGQRARQLIEKLRYHPEVPEEIFNLLVRQVERALSGGGEGPVLNVPADYLRLNGPRQPFRRIREDVERPSRYPVGMTLPAIPGMLNDTAFLEDTATVFAQEGRSRTHRVHVILTAPSEKEVETLAQVLARQRDTCDLRLTVFVDKAELSLRLPDTLRPDIVAGRILDARGHEQFRRILDRADLVICVDGRVELDECFIERAAHLVRISDNVFQPLVGMTSSEGLRTPFDRTDGKKQFSSRYPFRDVQGLNFAAPAALLRRAGPLDARFSSTAMAARELAFRIWMLGAYFAPLGVSCFEPSERRKDADKDRALYASLCPNAWDRKEDGQFERPRVSVYIPAYNASQYIARAVDSVLAQDLEDLEVCIADDGSLDGTVDLLARRYADEPRVRWTRDRNGGIGFASNRAIEMTRAPYVGQLDSDDCLKPGAVRRLMEYLDEHPRVVCCYGSCERIDQDGKFLRKEYNWPTFSREKMMITSIAHHFRMFRRSAWERTEKFREDIVNAVDYDIFLKLSETGEFHHVDEVLYQRRWHGKNTSSINEKAQTDNTYRVQQEALRRLGLANFWEVSVPDPAKPRHITYKRVSGRRMILFWPDYSRSNPYLHMLYGALRSEVEICAGDVDAALRIIDEFEEPSQLTFHLHWLNFLFRDVSDLELARSRAEEFIEKVRRFVRKGGRLIWTIHNTVSHDLPFPGLETEMSGRLARLAHTLHFHAESSVGEVARHFDVPRSKVCVSRHGNYIGAYPDFVSRAAARVQLNLAADDDVILFAGQIRPYKGVERLIEVFRKVLRDRPQALLLLAGEMKFDLFEELSPGLTEAEQARIRTTRRFVEEMEVQLFFRAADIAVLPYQKLLTSGSLMLAMGFGVPTAIPSVGMTREVLQGRNAGLLYDGTTSGLEQALRGLLAAKDNGQLSEMSANARRVAEECNWPDFDRVLAHAARESRKTSEQWR